MEKGDFYDNYPKLSQVASDQMEAELSKMGLLMALNTCEDSEPKHGTPFSTYKKLWSIAGVFILNLWKHSCNNGVLPASQNDSVITLLPKEG